MLLRFFACCLFSFWFGLAPDTLAAPAPHTVRLHYQRSAGDYDGWGLHVWGEFLDLGREVTWDKPLLPKGRDGFGIYFDIPVKPGASHIYFILHQENIKNFSRDIKWQITSQGTEIWQLEDDGTIYRSPPKGSQLAGLPAAAPAPPSGASTLPQLKLQEQLTAEQQERQLAERLVLQREQELAQMQQEAARREAQLQEKIQHIGTRLQQAEQQLKARQPANPALWLWPFALLLPLLWLGKRYWPYGLQRGLQRGRQGERQSGRTQDEAGKASRQ